MSSDKAKSCILDISNIRSLTGCKPLLPTDSSVPLLTGRWRPTVALYHSVNNIGKVSLDSTDTRIGCRGYRGIQNRDICRTGKGDSGLSLSSLLFKVPLHALEIF